MSVTHQDIHDTQKHYVGHLHELGLNTKLAFDLARLLWPDIKELEPEGDARRFRIQMTPLANTIGALICGDHNAAFHTGTGVLQTLTLIGMCSAVTSRFQPGYALGKIKPEVSFKSTVPIGSSVIMTTKKLKERGPLLVFTITAIVEETGAELFPCPRELTMYKITD